MHSDAGNEEKIESNLGEVNPLPPPKAESIFEAW